MNDKRFDQRPTLRYNFSAGKPLAGEERVSAGFKNKRPSRSSSEPRGAAPINTSFSLTGRAGQELPQRKRDKEEAGAMLSAALNALETVGGF